MSSASDLVAHLRPCPVEIEFDGRLHTIPAMDAVDWLVHIDSRQLDLYQIFPVLAGLEAVEHVEDALWEGRVDHDAVGRAALSAIGAAADREWWIVLRVIASAKEAWSDVHVNAATGMSLAGWLDAVWTNIMAHIDPKKRAGWISQIESTPQGWEGEVDFDDEERAFLAAMKAVM